VGRLVIDEQAEGLSKTPSGGLPPMPHLPKQPVR
jgi:hypothetical protein